MGGFETCTLYVDWMTSASSIYETAPGQPGVMGCEESGKWIQDGGGTCMPVIGSC